MARVNLYIPAKVVADAKSLNINMSEVAHKAIRLAIQKAKLDALSLEP